MAAAKRTKTKQRKISPDGNELLVLELQEIHSAESQLARAVPRLSKAVDSEQLGQMLGQRLEQGERLIQDIESALEELDESPGRKKNVAAEGLLNDLREHAQEIEAGPALDAVLIAGIQKTEHYCIAAWGTAKALGQAVGSKSVVRSMERALKEGKTMDDELTQLAESEITPALMAQGGDDGEEAGQTQGRGKNGSSERRAST